MDGETTLIITTRSGVRPLGVRGEPLHNAAPQLRRVVRRRLGDDLGGPGVLLFAFFAGLGKSSGRFRGLGSSHGVRSRFRSRGGAFLNRSGRIGLRRWRLRGRRLRRGRRCRQ